MTLAVALFGLVSANASNILDSLEYDMRLGYCIGGTAPINMPSTIRSLNSYSFQRNFSLGMDAKKQLNRHWGVMAGLRIENKGMHIDADVKNYHMAIVRGGERLEGYFTGKNNTKVEEWMFTIPVMATFSPCNNLILRCGPYASLLTSRDFHGDAYDGYLRVDDPTGPKVELGSDDGTRGSYDFSEDMRRMQYGIIVGVDWYMNKHLGIYADISWGLTGIFNSHFNTIEQTLYPIYGTIGLTYRIR